MDRGESCYGGLSEMAGDLLPLAQSILYTDEAFTPFLTADFQTVGDYARGLTQPCTVSPDTGVGRCNQLSPPVTLFLLCALWQSPLSVNVKYTKGPLASLGFVAQEICDRSGFLPASPPCSISAPVLFMRWLPA
jgi:hypothetical protein